MVSGYCGSTGVCGTRPPVEAALSESALGDAQTPPRSSSPAAHDFKATRHITTKEGSFRVPVIHLVCADQEAGNDASFGLVLR